MTKLTTTPFDAAKFIRTADDVLDTLNDALESGDAAYVASTLGVIARSEGMSKLASATGMNRQALYTALSECGNPTLDTLLKVLAALGVRLKAEGVSAAA
ncbi:addiction module antidote protein [Novosphingobium sp.]|uniref:addiction module antidote protein n=1 Tax=Novosphingobium sp. TaxID=1874826 RepID=UPI003BA8C450